MKHFLKISTNYGKTLLLLSTLILINQVSAADPIIHETWHFPYFTEVDHLVTIRANVSDPDLDLNSVFLDVRPPMGGWINNLPMAEISPGIFERQHNGTQRGTWDYRVHALDNLGNTNYSNVSYFFVVKIYEMDNVTISVNVRASCCGRISYFYVPDVVIQNQTVVFLIFFENCGNTDLDDRMFHLSVRNSTGSYIRNWSGYGTPLGTLEPGEEALFWTLWPTFMVPLGNYTAIAEVEYFGTLYSGQVYTNFSDLNGTYNCTPIDSNNLTNCTHIEILDCEKVPSTNTTTFNTNATSTATVSGMDNGSTAFTGGPINISGKLYNAYTFDMGSCSEYCYACLSNDSDLNESTECGYEGYFLDVVDYQVFDVSGDGQSVTFAEAKDLCNYRYTRWECVYYVDGTVNCTETVFCYGITRQEKDFMIVSELGEKETLQPAPYPQFGPYPLIIREMPPQINQEAACDPSDPWGTCTYSTVRFVLYNVGISNASNVTLSDIMVIGNCSAPNCMPTAVRCTNTSEYTCTVLSNTTTLNITFNLTDPIPPLEYRIIEYEIVPSNNTGAYNDTNRNYYQFNSTAYFKDLSRVDRQNITYYINENDPLYNPPPSKIMELRNVTAFNYDLAVNSNDTIGGRDFYINQSVSFNLTIISLTGEAQSTESWTADIPLPNGWSVTGCETPSPSYSCSFNATHLRYAGSITPATMSSLDMKFNATVLHEDFYLLPVNKTLTPLLREEYIPGLFSLAKEFTPVNITENITENVTTNTTTTSTSTTSTSILEPITSTSTLITTTSTSTTSTSTTSTSTTSTIIPEEVATELELAIDIKPLIRRINGTQGVFIPSGFNITNLGNVPADNITLIPIVPEGWEYKTAVVSYLNVSESTNRTIFVKAPYDAEGSYVVVVNAVRSGVTLDTDYFWINIRKAENLSMLQIEEAPRKVSVVANSDVTIPILIKNIGVLPLHDITARLENDELCVDSFSFTMVDTLDPNDVKPAYIDIKAKNKIGSCDTTLILWSREHAYAFMDITIDVIAPPPLIPPMTRLNLLLVLLIFLGILIAARKGEGKKKRRRRKKRGTLRILIYFIVSIIIFIIIYTILNFFGLRLM